MDLDIAKQGGEGASIWTQIKLDKFRCRTFHKAVLEPASQRLWLMGGFTEDNTTLNLQKLSLNVVPLQILSTEAAAKNIKEDDPSLETDRFPKKLKKDIEAYRCQ